MKTGVKKISGNCPAARKLTQAVREYKDCLTRVGTRPLIVFIWGQGFKVTYYYSVEFVKNKLRYYICNEPQQNNLKLVK